MKQFVHLRASPVVACDVQAFADGMAEAFNGVVRRYHPSVTTPDGPKEFWCSEYEYVTDRLPEALIPVYAARFLAIKDRLANLNLFEISFVIVSEFSRLDELNGYYLSREALATLVDVGWDVDIDVLRDIGAASTKQGSGGAPAPGW